MLDDVRGVNDHPTKFATIFFWHLKEFETRFEVGLFVGRNDNFVAAKVSNDFVEDVGRNSVDCDRKVVDGMSRQLRENRSNQRRGWSQDRQVGADRSKAVEQIKKSFIIRIFRLGQTDHKLKEVERYLHCHLCELKNHTAIGFVQCLRNFLELKIRLTVKI